MKKLMVLIGSICLVIGMVGFAEAKDKIVFGQALGLSGHLAPHVGFLDIPITKLWLEEVNKKGGIYVPEEGKRLPVELLRYDDKSDIPTTLKLFEKLATVDKVDIILPPCGTAWHLAVAPLAAKYNYPLVTYECRSERFREVAHKLRSMFIIVNADRESSAAFIELMVELGVKKAAMVYIAHEYGIEGAQCLGPIMAPAGVELVMFKSYPTNPQDLSPLLKEAKAANVDAFIAHSWAADTMLHLEQSMLIGFNPKLMYLSLGSAWPVFKTKFGPAIEGIMGPGGWNEKYSPRAKEFYDKFLAMHGRPPCNWSTAMGYAEHEIYQQAIEKIGLKDRTKLRDYIATHTFDTVYGPVKFVDYYNIYHPSYIGQWQKGTFEGVAPKATRKVNVIYPKPVWPK
jgi:branched-chain amino acid transport system substrate-binding protein